MSNQIDELIANIEQKFDDEFKDSSKLESPNKEKQTSNSNEHNPESDRKTNDQSNKYETTKKKDVAVIQQHENEESSQADHEQKNGDKLPYRQEQHSFEYHEGEEQEEDQNKYKELSHKLETALKKISSSKKQFGTFNTTASAKSDYLNRFQEYERKKEKDLQTKRKQEEEKKYLGLKSKPDINEKSRKMATETSYKPIYERYDKIVEDKKKKLESHQENKKLNEEQQYEQFMEEFKKHSKIQPDECRDINTYFHDMMAWKNKLEKDRDEKVKQKEQKATEGYTFKPEINKKSERLVKNQKRVPIQEREIERPRTEQSEYTFQPKINKRRVA